MPPQHGSTGTYSNGPIRTLQMNRLELDFHLIRAFLEEQECPCCTCSLLLPAFLCVNGHNICSICKPTTKACTICGEVFALRVTISGIPEYPCTYSEKGCKETYPVHVLRKHIPVCLRRAECPVIESHCRMATIPASISRGSGFKSQPGNRIS